VKIKLFLAILFSVILAGCNSDTTTATPGVITTPPVPVPIYLPITIGYPSPDTLIMAGTTFKYTVNGGKPPYSYTVVSGPGTVAIDGTFSAGDITGNTLIDIADSASAVLRVKVRVNALLKSDPINAKILVNNSITFSTTGGVPPYSFYIENGTGFINTLGTYTANSTPGNASIKIYDSEGNFLTTTVQSNYPLKISPPTLDLNRGSTFLFSASDGFPPYSYQVIGAGNINAITGSLTAPAVAQNIIVRVTDSMLNIASSAITVNSRALTLNSNNVIMEVNKSFAFKGDGGLAPYYFRLVTDSTTGTLLPSGIYIAPSAPSVATIEIKDSEDNTVLANIVVNNKLSISTFESCYDVGTINTTTTPNRSNLFYACGGVPPYSFQIVSGAGIIDNSNDNKVGVFSAPPTPGITVIQVRDSSNTIITGTIRTDPELAISPGSPTIAIGNSVIFIGSGGIPPYQFDMDNGGGLDACNPSNIYGNTNSYGTLSANGTFTAAFAYLINPVNIRVRIRDSVTSTCAQSKFATLKINPALSFAEFDISVRSGTEKIINASGGVPPYSLKFKNGASLIGSSITNTPDGLGGYIMKYAGGIVPDDVIEKLQITDSLNNSTTQNVTVFGGLVAFSDPKKLIITNTKTLDAASISLTNNSDLANINSPAHGLLNRSYIKMKDSVPCANIDDYEFDRQYQITYVDADNFLIKLIRKSNLTASCGSGSNYKYQVLSDATLSACPVSGEFSMLNLRNYTSTGEIKAKCVSGSFPFTGTFNSLLMNRTNNNNLVYNMNLTTTPESFVTVEMWFKWNGDRSPDTSPATLGSNGELVSFNNYNVSFMTVKNSNNTVNKGLCFNTTSSLDCYGFNNPEPIIANKWRHLVFIFSNSDVTKNRIYINGVERPVNKLGTADAVPRTVSGQFKVGASITNMASVYQTGGELGIVRVYDKDLSDNDVYNNYNEFRSIYEP
jgi:hypothetical protein